MIKLLILAIVAGLVTESQQHDFSGFSHSVSDLSFEAAHDQEEHVDYGHSGGFSLPPTAVGPCFYPVDTKCWTEWFDRDDPCGNGDREEISDLLIDYPGQMCEDPVDIEVETLSGKPVSETGDVIQTMDTTTGFICKNNQQSGGANCQDYRVRFSCYSPFCAPGVCWTPWFDRDNPSGTGDWELLSVLKEEFPGKICEKPRLIEAMTVDTLEHASSSGEELFVFNPTEGFVCRMTDQSDNSCKDYKVRFGCPCKYITTYW